MEYSLLGVLVAGFTGVVVLKLLGSFSFILMTLISGWVYAGPTSARDCSSHFQEKRVWLKDFSGLSQSQIIDLRYQHMTEKEEGTKIGRYPKLLTTGERKDAVPTMDPADAKIDTADPSLVMPIHYPNGQVKFRINFSGLRYIEADSAQDFYRGGIHQVKRSRGFYEDGTEMVGPYHNASWPWDAVIYQNDSGQQIALGGVMKQPAPHVLPNVAIHNPTRSRWWGEVKHVQVAPNEFEERIIWKGPVHDFNHGVTDEWEFHGYGGTLLTKFNPLTKTHEPLKNKDGNYSLFYERVVEQKTMPDGTKLPWITNLFMREMDPSMTRAVGPEIPVTNIVSPVTGKPYEATRRGDENHTSGYLAEGGNVLIEISRNQAIKAWSGNDYVRKYGIYLDYRDPNTGVAGMFKPVLDDRGELVDFAKKLKLREMLHATWLGRPQMEYDPNGKLWLRFHFVPIKSIPEGGPIEGWPSAEQFVKYGRISAQIPVRITLDKKGQPQIELDIDPEYRALYRVQ